MEQHEKDAKYVGAAILEAANARGVPVSAAVIESLRLLAKQWNDENLEETLWQFLINRSGLRQ